MRDMGLVSQVFSEESLQGLHGQAAIAHCRYSTTGSVNWTNAQPVVLEGPARRVALGHNGNLVNTAALRKELDAMGVKLRTTSDTEVIAAFLAHDERPLEEAVAATMRPARGRVRDRRPLRGQAARLPRPAGHPPARRRPARERPDHRVRELRARPARRRVRARGRRTASWSSATRTGCAASRPCPRTKGGGALCIFEFIYFARPDTKLRGVELHGARVRMGERLAEESPVAADIVIGVPDSGTPAAIGFARASGIPFNEGLIKNRYVGRTFIQPDQALREHGIKTKFNPLGEVTGKRIVVVDDSIVRGTTTRKIVAMLFEEGAEEVHVRVSSPPIVSPCFYGIDMATEGELIAGNRSVEEVRDQIGATTLAYLSLDGLQAATRRPEGTFCRACLTRKYPTDGARRPHARQAPLRAHAPVDVRHRLASLGRAREGARPADARTRSSWPPTASRETGASTSWDEDGRLFSGLHHGPLVRVRPEYDPAAERLALTFPDGRVVEEQVELGEPKVTAFWDRPVRGRYVEGPWSDALSDYAGKWLRLVRVDDEQTGYDSHPVSILGDASVAKLGKKSGANGGIDARRFRMLIALAGTKPHAGGQVDRPPGADRRGGRVRRQAERALRDDDVQPGLGHARLRHAARDQGLPRPARRQEDRLRRLRDGRAARPDPGRRPRRARVAARAAHRVPRAHPSRISSLARAHVPALGGG